MCILTKNQGSVGIALRIMLNMLRLGVHRAYNIGVPLVPRLLILNGTHLVAAADKEIGLVEVIPVSGLVTQGPDHHRRMVFVPLEHIACTEKVCLCPVKVVGQTFTPGAIVTHTM